MDLLSLHLRMHIGREERAADSQNVGQRTMTSSRRACDLQLHNRDTPPHYHHRHLFQHHPHQSRQGGSSRETQPPPSPSLSLSVGGRAETGQGSDLISQEGREKGAARWIRVLPWLYFIPSPPLTPRRACVVNAARGGVSSSQQKQQSRA